MLRPILVTRFDKRTQAEFMTQVPDARESEEHAAIKYWLNTPKIVSPTSLVGFDGVDDGRVCVLLMLNGTIRDRNDNKTNRIWGIVIIDLLGVRIGYASNRKYYSENRRNIYGYPVLEFFPLYEPEWEPEVLPLERRVQLNSINSLLFSGKGHQKRGSGITGAQCIHDNSCFPRFVDWAIAEHRQRLA